MREHKLRICLIALSLVFFFLGLFLKIVWWGKLIFYLASAILVGYNVVLNAISNICHGRIFDENLLMSVASICAFAIGEFAEGALVLILSQIGELLQSIAVGKSRKEIASIMALRPSMARLLKEHNETEEVFAEEIEIGDIIQVLPGESVPLDCEIIQGETRFDMSSLTGESVPVYAKVGDKAISGSINLSGMIVAKVTASYENSTIVKMLDLIENSQEKKTKTEKFITKFSKIYTPTVFGLALLITLICPLFTGYSETFTTWLSRALVFLVISCPCALVISVPLAFFGGIGSASKLGVLVKGSEIIEKLASADCVAFDKTGTLTHGDFGISKFYSIASEDEFFKVVCSLEKLSNHPLSYAFEKYQKDKNVELLTIQDFKELAGEGIVGKIGKDTYFVGKKKCEEDLKLDFEPNIYVYENDIFFGAVLASDSIKESASKLISDLKELKISKFAMLTGDNEKVANSVAGSVGISKVYSSLMPEDKVNVMLELKKDCKSLVYMGDGINDAGVLALADVGVSMGKNGADLAIETSDVVISSGEISKLSKAIKLARKTMRIAKENIVLSLGVKLVAVILGLCGIVNLWIAVFADVGVTLLAVLNASRLLKRSKT